MPQATLTRILEDIKTLETEELQQIERAIQEQRVASAYGYSLEEWRALQSLSQAGLLEEIKPRRLFSSGERRRIQVQGKPLSETMLEERR